MLEVMALLLNFFVHLVFRVSHQIERDIPAVLRSCEFAWMKALQTTLVIILRWQEGQVALSLLGLLNDVVLRLVGVEI
jgi:hypothetical protein